MNIEFTVQGNTFRAEVNLIPYVPARTYGPPENCYPEEGGEIEIETLELVEGDLFDLLPERIKGLVNEAAYLAAYEEVQDMKNEAAISQYESSRDYN